MASLNFLNINSIHLSFLAPLVKWRILDLKSLIFESEYPSHHTVFEKMIRRLEKAQVLNSFKDPWSKQKFVYLTSEGEKLVNDSDNSIMVSESTMLHDAKVAQFTRLMLSRECFLDVKFDHLVGNKGNGKLPDGILYGEKKSIRFMMAFELEITRKSKSRIREKINYYLDSSYYDYILYLFCSPQIKNSYQNCIYENFGDEAFKKIMLFWNPSIMARNIDLDMGGGYFKSREVSFNELF